MLNEYQLEMAKQINAKELNFAKFQLLSGNNNDITVMKGKKFVKITYVPGRDTYTVVLGKIKNFEVVEEKVLEDVYNDMLQSLIEGHFPNFEYVMDGLFGGSF